MQGLRISGAIPLSTPIRLNGVERDNVTFSILVKVVIRETHVICEFHAKLFQDGRK